MKCAYCGKNNKQGALVCKRCGIALPVPPPPVRGEGEDAPNGGDHIPPEGMNGGGSINIEPGNGNGKKTKRVRIAGIAAALAALIALVAVILSLAGSGNGTVFPVKKAYSVFLANEWATVFYKGEDVTPVNFNIEKTMLCSDGSVVCMLADNGSDLFVSREGETRDIAKEVNSFTLCVKGNKVVYTDKKGLLWIADTKDSSAAPICVCSSPVENEYAVSPNGGTVLYSVGGKLFCWNGSSKELVDGMTAVSVSDGAGCIYAISNSDNALYAVSKRGKKTFIRSNLIAGVYLNQAHDEIVFSTDAGAGKIITMCSMRGKEPREVLNSSEEVVPVIPVNCIMKAENQTYAEVFTTPFKHFEGKYFAGASLVKFSAKGSAVIEPVKCHDAATSKNGKTVIFINGSTLKRRTEGEASAETLAENCEDYIASTDCRIVWYTGFDNGSLYCLNGTVKELISPATIWGYAVTPDGKTAVFRIGGSVFCNKGGTPKNTFAYEGLTVEKVFADRNGVRIKTEKGWDKLPSGGKRIDLTK